MSLSTIRYGNRIWPPNINRGKFRRNLTNPEKHKKTWFSRFSSGNRKKHDFSCFYPGYPPHPPLPPLKGVPPPRRGVSGTVFRGFDPLYPPLPPLPPWIPPETQKNDENHDFCKKSWFSSFFGRYLPRIPFTSIFFWGVNWSWDQNFPSIGGSRYPS